MTVLVFDQSFLRNITVHPDHAAIVGGIILLAHSLHLKVIAEGVETQAQLAYLHHHDCDEIQGNLFSEAVPVAQFKRVLLEARRVLLDAGAPVVSSNTYPA
jgi:EAL domain-containing protein (putative c-di-GMP-specific phosphodiesterase class I)